MFLLQFLFVDLFVSTYMIYFPLPGLCQIQDEGWDIVSIYLHIFFMQITDLQKNLTINLFVNCTSLVVMCLLFFAASKDITKDKIKIKISYIFHVAVPRFSRHI